MADAVVFDVVDEVWEQRRHDPQEKGRNKMGQEGNMRLSQRFLVVGNAEEVEEVGRSGHEEEDEEQENVQTDETQPPSICRSRQVMPKT